MWRRAQFGLVFWNPAEFFSEKSVRGHRLGALDRCTAQPPYPTQGDNPMNTFRFTTAIAATAIAGFGFASGTASATDMCWGVDGEGMPYEYPCPELPELPEYEFDFGGGHGWQPGDGLPGGTATGEEPAEEPAADEPEICYIQTEFGPLPYPCPEDGGEESDPADVDLGDYELIPVPGYEFPFPGNGSGSGDSDAPAEEPAADDDAEMTEAPADEPAADEPSSDPEDIIPDGIEPEAIEPAGDADEPAADAPAEEALVVEDDATAVEADASAVEATIVDTPAVDESGSSASDDDVIVLSGSTSGETITVQETITGTFTQAEDAGTVAAPVNNSSASQSATVDRAVDAAVEIAAEAQSDSDVPQLRVVDGTEVFADLALDTPAADDADELSDDDANSAGGRGIGTLIAALGLLVLGGGGATAAGVKVLRDRD